MVSKKENSFYMYISNNLNNEKLSGANFVIKLPETFILTNDYEVGLVEMFYTKDWLNIPDEQCIEMSCDKYFDFPPFVCIEADNYDSIVNLIDDINYVINDNRTYYNFIIVPSLEIVGGKIVLRPGICNRKPDDGLRSPPLEHHLCFPTFPQYLSEVLGFVNKENQKLSKDNFMEFVLIDRSKQDKLMYTSSEVIEHLYYDYESDLLVAQRPYKIPKISFLNIQTNIVTPSINGNKYEKTLANVRVPTDIKQDHYIRESVDNPLYQEISHTEIKEILIQILDEQGCFIKFKQNSQIHLVLEFRKKNEYWEPIRSILR